MKSAAEKLNLQTFLQRSRDHLLPESGMRKVLYVDQAFVNARGLPPAKRSSAEAMAPARADSRDPEFKPKPVTSTWLRPLLKGGLYFAAILLLPGALIGAPVFWWLANRRKKSPQPAWRTCS